MRYQASAAKQILDPREWLPSYGESSIKFRSENLMVTVEIYYETERDGIATAKRELRFFDVCFFSKTAFPGPNIPSAIVYDGTGMAKMMGSLIQFEHSDVAVAWATHFGNQRNVKHYVMQFMSENVEIEVFCTGYELSEEILV